MSCPICGAPAPAPFLDRRGVPILQNAPAGTPAEARARARGDLAITTCNTCGFVWNAAFDPRLVEYSQSYDNTQCCSPGFERYLEELAAALIARYDLRGKTIVEVGCGKGHFLRLLCRLGGNTGFGFDPTYVGPEVVETVTFVRELYSAKHAVPNTDFVCCRHVLEHVPDPLAMLAAIREAAGAAPVFFEVPTIDWIVEHDCWWDFFYEHCNYFSARTLHHAFERAGYEVASIAPAFGDQYLWLHARAAAPHADVPARDPAIDAFAARVDARIAELAASVRARAADGGIAIWGAGAKGVTLANLLDPDGSLVRYVIDINPNKQGGFIPGTGHRIVAPATLATEPVRHVLGTNPNYRTEIEASVGSQPIVFTWL